MTWASCHATGLTLPIWPAPTPRARGEGGLKPLSVVLPEGPTILRPGRACALQALPYSAACMLPPSIVRFQLERMWHLLLRPARGVLDPRVSFGCPDPWQVELLDTVDAGAAATPRHAGAMP